MKKLILCIYGQDIAGDSVWCLFPLIFLVSCTFFWGGGGGEGDLCELTDLLLVFVLNNFHFFSYIGAAYCVCKDGLSDQALQKSLDYACGAGADCTPIVQNGACYSPNTVKNHCDYAVNSYYQKKSQAQGSCDFSGTATVSQTAPSKSLWALDTHPPAIFVY